MKKQFAKPAKQAKNVKPKKETAASQSEQKPKTTTRRKKLNTLDDITPLYASLEESMGSNTHVQGLTRKNKAASIERTDRFK